MVSSTFKFMLGLFPKTEVLEKKNLTLTNEYAELQEYLKSETLARYEYLLKYISSKEFVEKKQNYLSHVFNGSPEENKENEYLSKKKSHDIKSYFKYKSSPAYSVFANLDGSKTIQDFEQLRAFVESPQYKKVAESFKDKNRFEKTQEFQKYQEYKSLKENQSFIHYFKFIHESGYNDFKTLYKSTKIADFEALEKYIHSTEFESLKSSIPKAEFEASDAHKKFLEYSHLKKSPEITHYITLSKSPLLGDYKKLQGSEELRFYNELEAFVKSPAYTEKKHEIENLRFESTEEYAKLHEYKKLSESSDIIGYYKTKLSKEFTEFRRIESSKLIPDFQELEKYIQSDEFKNRKEYLLDSKKWEKSDEFKLFSELESLKKDPKIIWYFKTKDSNKFDEFKSWNLVFEDDFTSSKLDKGKWITRYFWGEALLNGTYALPGEKHLFNDDKNIQCSNSLMQIATKKEKVTGNEWNPMLGFYPREFNYTSAIINSGGSFRTKYGKFEAKIKMRPVKGVIHAFWLAGETMVPQIDVFKCYENKFFFSTFWGNPVEANSIKNDTASIPAGFIKDKFLIYSLEWAPGIITWKINDIVVKTQNSNVPDTEMFVVLNSGVLIDDAEVSGANLEVDWIRCYQKA